MAMSDPMSEPSAQPRALIKARNKVCLAGGLLVRFFDSRQNLLKQHLTSAKVMQVAWYSKPWKMLSRTLPGCVHVGADLCGSEWQAM